jgi:hypothetical protein
MLPGVFQLSQRAPSQITVPRPLPSRRLPALAAALVFVLALPFFLIAGWPLVAWALAVALWVGVEALDLVAARLASRDVDLRTAGMAGFVRMFRLFLVAIMLAATVKLDRDLALPLIAVFALAYTLELGISLISYFGNKPL